MNDNLMCFTLLKINHYSRSRFVAENMWIAPRTCINISTAREAFCNVLADKVFLTFYVMQVS